MDWSLNNKGHWPLVLGLALLSLILRFIALNQTAHPNGWDGYYYVMQVHSWMSFGYLQSVDYSLIYPYFLVITYFLGDFALAFKVGSAILSAAIIATIYFLILKFSRRTCLAFLGIAFLLFSPTMTYFTSQFPKNALGLVFFCWFLYVIADKRWPLVVLFGTLSFLTHRMIGGMVVVVLTLLWIQQINWKWIVLGGLVFFLLSLLPGLLHVSDFQRFQGAFTYWPQFAPYVFFQLFQNELSLWWQIEILMLSVILVWLAVLFFSNRSNKSLNEIEKLVLPVLVLLSVFPFFQMANGSMGYRFFMIAPFFIIITLLSVVKISRKWSVFLTTVLIIISCFSFRSYDPLKHDPPNHVYEVITDRLQVYFDPTSHPLVISHKSLAEMIIYKTNFDALNWAPPPDIDKGKTLRVVHNLQYFHFTKYLNEEELEGLQKLTLHYYMMTEQIWGSFLERVKAAEDADLLKLIERGKNPLEPRPGYLRKGKQL